MKRLFYVSFALICLMFGACDSTSTLHQNKEFNPNNIRVKWRQNDDVYLKEYISRLADKTLSDPEYFDRISELSNTTGFVFGNADVQAPEWKAHSVQERTIFREKTTLVYQLYTQSQLFMKPVSWSESLKFQDWFRSKYSWYSTPLSKEDQATILIQINQIPYHSN